jgi:hypothetical protein
MPLTCAPSGLLPLLLYASFFALMPLLFFYMDYDYANDGTRVGVILSSALAALIVMVANSCVAWFNIALFLHTAVEVRVVKTLFDFADDASSADATLAYVTGGVIIAHLVPFFVLEMPRLLSLLAAVGVVVNASALVYVDSSQLPLASTTALTLLASTLVFTKVLKKKVTLWTAVQMAMASGTCLRF